MSPAFTIGLDYGTNSVRAVVVDCADGSALGTHVFSYPSGDHGVIVDAREPHLARQNPADYLEGLRQATRGALAAASAAPGFAAERVIGIGVDTTGSTPLPVDGRARPLAIENTAPPMTPAAGPDRNSPATAAIAATTPTTRAMRIIRSIFEAGSAAVLMAGSLTG